MVKHIELTELKKAFETLDFEEKIRKDCVLFANYEHDALIILPQGRDEFGEFHIGMVKKVLEKTGIMERDEFEDLFDGVGNFRSVVEQ